MIDPKPGLVNRNRLLMTGPNQALATGDKWLEPLKVGPMQEAILGIDDGLNWCRRLRAANSTPFPDGLPAVWAYGWGRCDDGYDWRQEEGYLSVPLQDAIVTT